MLFARRERSLGQRKIAYLIALRVAHDESDPVNGLSADADRQ